MPLVTRINEWEAGYQKNLRDEDFPVKTEEFKQRLQKGETLEDLLPEAFALVKNACRRLAGRSYEVRGREAVWNMIPYDVQLIGGVVLHQGKIAEMKTGEGKTLVCTMPVYLNALTGKGVFVVTVNDYLAHRDAEWMGLLYGFLGMRVGVITHGQSPEAKKEAYDADITYGTNNEFGFDYLRDNMATDPEYIVQRALYYAIVDEVDSILIDEARTPLIISAPAEESTEKYRQYSRLILQLKENVHYNIDEKQRTATLTEEGVAEMERLLGMENIYTEAGFQEVHHIEQALKAHAIFKNDSDYIVKDGEVMIVDEFTGRLMPGRAGMTGTAATEAEEFGRIYKLDVIEIPTHRVVVRTDYADAVYKNKKGKLQSVVARVKELSENGQPVLIGTISIEKSEVLSRLLAQEGVPHTVLNAKQHEKEAEIVAQAGQKGAVTIATNMAGRGTDIKLGEGVAELGGLFILGTERHESRRIDNQLRGRSGRQGDAGASQFYVSMEDDLMRLFGGERMQKMMEFFNVPDDMPIQNGVISNSIESAQKKVEGRNFEVRKHLVEYDDVMNQQREIIYKKRRKVLLSDNIKNDVILLIEEVAEGIVLNNTAHRPDNEWNIGEIVQTVRSLHSEGEFSLTVEDVASYKNTEDMIELVKHYLWKVYEERERNLPDFDPEKSQSAAMRQVERAVYLRTIDILWMEHIDAMTHLREAVSFHGYAQRNPLVEYKKEGYDMFVILMNNVRFNTVSTLFKMKFEREPVSQIKLPQKKLKMMTNEDEIGEVLSGEPSSTDNEQSNPTVI
ncbi:MAG: Protein translocase subunit SecA, partial [Candidatus Peregrinibacteria bacterium GW2011_GWA2_47_7]